MTRSFWPVKLVALLCMLFVAMAHISSSLVNAQGMPMILPVDPVPLVIEASSGEKKFTIEVADNDAKRSAGLMFRTSMGDQHGMLFVFERTQRVAFWMKNTPMPLDLIFISEKGQIAAIMQGEPFSTASIAPDAEVRFVLELKSGTSQSQGIAVGDYTRHPLIDSIANQ